VHAGVDLVQLKPKLPTKLATGLGIWIYIWSVYSTWPSPIHHNKLLHKGMHILYHHRRQCPSDDQDIAHRVSQQPPPRQAKIASWLTHGSLTQPQRLARHTVAASHNALLYKQVVG
jgi:hypothetical protein